MAHKWRDYLKYLFPFIVGVLLFAFITDYEKTLAFTSAIFGGILYVLTRFLIAFSIAYIINFPVNWLRAKLRLPRLAAIIVSYILFVGLLVWMLVYIIPLMIDGLTQLFTALQDFIPTAQQFVANSFTRLDTEGIDLINSLIGSVTNALSSVLSSILNVSSLESIVRTSTRLILNILFGLLISLYALLEKESLIRNCKKIMYAFLKSEKADKSIGFLREANTIFSQFFVGKFVDSAIIGILSAICYTIFGLPLTPFLAVLAAICNMIPYFGPIVGMVITVIILLCFNPIQALYGLIICIVLQILDGSVIGVKILGSAVGISPLLTIVAITVGGDLAGLMGILLGIPILATFKTLIYDRVIKSRLEKRQIQIE